MSYKVGVIGSDDDTYPFYQVGVETFPFMKGEALARQIAKLVKDGYTLLFISEECLADHTSLLHSYDKDPLVALIPIPSIHNNKNIGRQRIQEMAEKALGQKIL